MFSFNSPFGACDACDGLGIIQYIDPSKLMPDEDVSITNGAIKGWTRRNRFYFYQLKCLAKHYDFSLTTKWSDLDEKYKDIIVSKIPSGRLGEPDDIANAVLFLLSDQSNYINGETIHVNGGMYMA